MKRGPVRPIGKAVPGPLDARSLLAQAAAAERAGRAAEAEECCRRAHALTPDAFSTNHALGTALLSREDAAAALPFLARAVALDPGHAVARLNLGAACRRLALYDQAIGETRRARILAPNLAETHFNLGATLDERRIAGADRAEHYEAESAYRVALALKPGYVKALYNLAQSLIGRSESAAALGPIERACAIDPALGVLHSARATALRLQERMDDAAAAYRRAVMLDPSHAPTLFNFGNLHLAVANPAGAADWYGLALALRPDDPEYRWNHALALLSAGQYAQGWRAYEWRWRWPGFSEPSRSWAAPAWEGTGLGKRTILLHAEQGLGDTIQFIRYAPQVRRRCGRVVLQCQPELIRLLQGYPGIDALVRNGEALPAHDAHAPLLSLPRIFHTELETIPPPLASAAARPAFDLPLSGKALRIGIAWAGNPKHGKDRQRSVEPGRFAALAALPGIQLYSLQVGPRAPELAAIPGRDAIVDLAPRLTDFADAAAAIDALDLVIAVDTAIAHLAGTLGRETWILLSYAPDWRWLTQRDDTPWYPSVRLFRQRAPGDWDDVFARVAAALTARMAERAQTG
ncbi:MAG: tetratricopeptide repeat protein [Alphaproteobacteria bacterium]|nr:tetratricopeptide repeat protein [Alphaproteobacteria bacterium]